MHVVKKSRWAVSFVNYSRNDSGKVVVDMEIIFGQYVEMKLFITLYQALYRNGSIGDLPVQPIWDNSKLSVFNSMHETINNHDIKFLNTNILFCLTFLVPGKPAQNILGQATGTTSILVEWNTVPVESDIILLNVFYVKTSKPNETISRTDVNVTKQSVKIENLEKFVNYTVWVQSVSTRGLGISSIPIYVRTLEEGESSVLKVHTFIFFWVPLNICFILHRNLPEWEIFHLSVYYTWGEHHSIYRSN